MLFDVVITTYNRPKEVIHLAKSILTCEPAPENIIIVDSSDQENFQIKELPKVVYVRSSHKNQPYQRLLGVKVSKADIVVFLDDDLLINNQYIFDLLRKKYFEANVIGVTVGINYHSSIQNQLETPVFDAKLPMIRWVYKLSGIVTPLPGKIGRLGIVGPKPTVTGEIDFFYGPCMSFKKDIIQNIIPHDLMSQAECKLSMGEDKVISMLALEYGKLLYVSEVCLLHPANESTYFANIRSFSSKVTYSRLYLSHVYAKVFHKSAWKELLIYYWFITWRIIIALLSLVLRPSKGRKENLLGTLDGLWLSLRLPQKANRLTPGLDWQAEIAKDLATSNVMI